MNSLSSQIPFRALEKEDRKQNKTNLVMHLSQTRMSQMQNNLCYQKQLTFALMYWRSPASLLTPSSKEKQIDRTLSNDDITTYSS